MPRVPGVPYKEDQRPWAAACEKVRIAPPWPDWLGYVVEYAYFGRGDSLRLTAPADRDDRDVERRAVQVLTVMRDPELREAVFAMKALAGRKAAAAAVDAAIDRSRTEFFEWCLAQGLP